MSITEFRPQNQNVAQAPILGEQSGTFGANAQQRKNIAQGGSGRFTNLQQYVQANEANNPNAQLLQREATARQGELGTKQQQFTTQAAPIKTGLETIRSGQQFVQSALADPTQYTTPERLEQFKGYRTGGVGDVETPYNQFQALRTGLGTQQEQLASGLETIQRDPNALQNYIQSQRANPALATRGENVLDRFLTQSTASGQRAIAGLGTAASGIRASQAPAIVGQIEALKTQTQGQPLSSADVKNLLTGQITPQEQFVRDINPSYLADKIGVSPVIAREISGQVNKSRANQSELLNTLNMHNVAIEGLNKGINRENELIEIYNKTIANTTANREDIAQAEKDKKTAEGNINLFKKQINERNQAKKPFEFDLDAQQRWYQQYYNRNKDVIDKYNIYENRLGNTKQELLSEYDPARLSKIQALQKLAGTTQFDPLLQTRLT